MSVNVGLYLKNERNTKGLALKDVSNAIGATDTQVSRIETGATKSPDPIVLKKLAGFYGIDAVTIFKIAGYLSDEDLMDYKQMFSGASLLSEEQREHMQKVINWLTEEKNSTLSEQKVFKLGELFCGPGGIAWGALHAKSFDGSLSIAHEWANDYDLNTCKTYRFNICPSKPETVHHGDVRKLNMESLNPIDALAFGFPCNDFSVVGEQKGMDGVYGPLYSYGVKALKHFKPKWFLAENVGGLKNANEGKAFTKILADLQSAGYKITPHLYKFEEYGVPQARHRIIIVGIREDLPYKFKVPSPKPYSQIDNSCKKAIEDPPIPSDAPNNERTRQSETVVKRLGYIKPGQNAFTADIPEALRLNVGGVRISQIYKRLDPDKPAYTVTGSGGGGTHIYHWAEPRALTNRERARLQTFPDSFIFHGNKESVRKQIGMAVPCNGAKIIFEAILNTFAGNPYEHIDANINE